MKTFFRIFHYARPVGKFAVPYFFTVILHALFNTFNFVLIIPILNTLFDGEKMTEAISTPPPFDMSLEWVQGMIKYYIFDIFGTGYDVHDVLVFISALIVGSVLLSNLFRFISQKIMENFRIQTLQNLRDNLFKSIMSQNVRFFSNERKGDIISKLTSDINLVQFSVTNTLQVAFKEPALLIGYFVALVMISVKLTLFTLAILPITAFVIGTIVKTLRKKATDAQEALGEMTSIADEAMGGVKVIKAYNATDYVVGKYIDTNNKYSSLLRRMATRQQMASPMSEFLGVSAVSVILIYGGNMVVSGELDAGAFMAYLAAFSQVTRPARSIADSFSTIHQGLAAGDRVIELMDMEPQISDNDGECDLAQFKNDIEFKNVSFSYEDKRVLHDISFTIKRGEAVALVGASGGGKSTIADLLSRYYDVEGGEILIDGRNIKDYRLPSLRNHIGTVSQDIVLFNDTIEQNIKLGNLVATRDDVVRAAKVANAHSFINETSDSYDTTIGDRGMKLSGGQRQRLSIARAVLKNPDILILDEATSALDTESERLVQDSLTSLLKDRTSLIIAHRLSTIQHCDKIIVIDNGNIVEQGKHDELIERGGVYAGLVKMQMVDHK